MTRLFAAIPAADNLATRGFGHPRPLTSLGSETVVGRLVRQLTGEGVQVVVGRGEAGESGWTREHVEEISLLPCEVIKSPHNNRPRFPSTSGFLMQYLADSYSIEPDDKLFLIPGDYIFADSLLQELLDYDAPCIYEFRDKEMSVILNEESLPIFCKWATPTARMEGIMMDTNYFRNYGWAYICDVNEYLIRFAEVDWPSDMDGVLEFMGRQ